MSVTGALLVQFCFVVLASDGPQSAQETQDMLSAMRENEALYDDLEVRYTYVIESLQVPPKAEQAAVVRRGEDRVWAVWNYPRYYGRVESDLHMFDGKHDVSNGEYAFDGELSRMNYRGNYGNIVDKRVSNNNLRPPHRWGAVALADYALVDYLEFSAMVRAVRAVRARGLPDSR